MKCRCEVAVQEIIPVARSMIAKKLIEQYGFSQTCAAKRMGITQPAISQYRKNIRGTGGKSLAKNPGFVGIVNDVAKRIADGSLKAEHLEKEMCRFCDLLRT